MQILSTAGGRKVFVGSLPDGIEQSAVREKFSKFGPIEEVFVKVGAEPGRQWAMVTYVRAEDARAAKEATDRVLWFPGSIRPVEVLVAKNQAHDPLSGASKPSSSLPRKVHVGSLPDTITEDLLRDEFGKYGNITEVLLRTGCPPGKQWALITYSNADEAALAKHRADRVLKFPGNKVPVEVMYARFQGTNGQDPLQPSAAVVVHSGPTKIWVGSLPDGINEIVLQAEFSQYGQITDVAIKAAGDPPKVYAFVCFATSEQAERAKDACHRVLVLPGATSPCEVLFAKNQGLKGQDPLYGPAVAQRGGTMLALPASAEALAHGAWVCCFTDAGLPYYYNYQTGVTQWDCPMELQNAARAQHAPARPFATPCRSGAVPRHAPY